MSEETAPIVQHQPAVNVGNQVNQVVDLQFKMRDLLAKYTDRYKGNEDYERLKASYVLMVKGLYSELDRQGTQYGDGQQITHEFIFEKANELWGQEKKVEALDGTKPNPPKTSSVPSGLEGAVTTTTGHETFTPENFPLHDNDTWLKVRQEHRRKIKTLKTDADSRNLVKGILESIVV